MAKQTLKSGIKNGFKRTVDRDTRIRNAYLLVHSDKLNTHMNLARGKTGDFKADTNQPIHLASVGKLFTATIISSLYEKGKLDFDDRISKYLDPELMDGLHIYRGKDHSDQITIRQLLMQTSGLYDVFYHLLEKMSKDSSFKPTTREAIFWGKENLKPVAVPGKIHFYTDTNYHLLGLIIESITKKPFYKVVHELIFDPLEMNNAYMYGFSKPRLKSSYPLADLFLDGIDFKSVKGIHKIDYAGGSVCAPLEEYLLFFKRLVEGKIIREETFKRMIDDDIYMGFPTLGFRYGYSIWKPITIPLLMPKKYFCFGCVGVTGAFMFYHPNTRSYMIGSFNDSSYRAKALQFMISKVIKELLKCD
ncbi:MAG: serine hydrolase domain-containing protein [Nanobdellota archaeon]